MSGFKYSDTIRIKKEKHISLVIGWTPSVYENNYMT